ncbi:Uu.00g047040.m01.CDS01 [Anthostomella pinea]|uniref:Uu.00g047040.m01.CDS01 n=1 Tax=Anthostomella pinea TaxID=933095 RepID=A0AAI8VCG4_9PEZI|nr:Uu.00g047040.m01.CDS01 [Anthostomella pinea]
MDASERAALSQFLNMDTSERDTLLSVLCGQWWNWDSWDCNRIKFNQDGTGQMICRARQEVFIAAEFDWQPLHTDILDQELVMPIKNPKAPMRLAQFDIVMRLTNRRIPILAGQDLIGCAINECLLEDDAFYAKAYNVSLERGRFLTPFDALGGQIDPYTPTFSLGLAFDRSPFPQQHEWKVKVPASLGVKLWDRKEFCGKQYVH